MWIYLFNYLMKLKYGSCISDENLASELRYTLKCKIPTRPQSLSIKKECKILIFVLTTH